MQLVTVDDLTQFQKELIETLMRTLVPAIQENQSDLKPFYSTKETAELFGVSARCLQNWRDEGKIGYVRQGKTILYRKEDIVEFCRVNHQKPFKGN